MKMIVRVALALLASGSFASAQSSFTGSWDVEANPPWTVVFRANQPTVVGRVSRCSSQVTAEIFDARIEGNVISFKCRSGDGDRTLTLRELSVATPSLSPGLRRFGRAGPLSMPMQTDGSGFWVPRLL